MRYSKGYEKLRERQRQRARERERERDERERGGGVEIRRIRCIGS